MLGMVFQRKDNILKKIRGGKRKGSGRPGKISSKADDELAVSLLVLVTAEKLKITDVKACQIVANDLKKSFGSVRRFFYEHREDAMRFKPLYDNPFAFRKRAQYVVKQFNPAYERKIMEMPFTWIDYIYQLLKRSKPSEHVDIVSKVNLILETK